MSKKRMITKSVIFLLILAFILKIFSSLSITIHRRQQCIQQHFPSRMVGTTGIYRIYLGTAKPAYPGNLRIFKKNLQTPETIYRPN